MTMNTTRKLACILLAGATLGAAAPVFADSRFDRNRDRGHDRYSNYQRHNNFDRRDHRDYVRQVERRRVVVVQRPYVVERRVPVYYSQPAPVYYPEPAPAANIGLGAMIGAVIGGIYDSQQ